MKKLISIIVIVTLIGCSGSRDFGPTTEYDTFSIIAPIVITAGVLTYAIIALNDESNYIDVDYVGKKYNPTNEVEIFTQNELNNNCKYMGELVGKLLVAYKEFDVEDLQNAMLEKAKSVGADIIVFDKLEKDFANVVEHNDTQGKFDKHGNVDIKEKRYNTYKEYKYLYANLYKNQQ